MRMLLVKQFLNSVGRGQHGVSDFGTMDLPPRKYFSITLQSTVSELFFRHDRNPSKCYKINMTYQRLFLTGEALHAILH